MKVSTSSHMTPRQRLLATLRGEPVDRPPVWLLFPYHPIGCYVDVRTHPAYRPVHEASLGRCAILNRRNLNAGPFFQPEVIEHWENRAVDGVQEKRYTLSYKGRSLESWTRTGPAGTTVKKLLESEEDLAFYAELPVQADPAAIRAAAADSVRKLRQEREEFPEECGAMMMDLGEPICNLYSNAKLEEFAVWSLTCPDLVQALLDRHMARFRCLYDLCLDAKVAEIYFNVGSELAAPPLVGHQTFRQWILPYAQELIARIHAGGALSIQHFHGQVRDLLPAFVEMGADALHTIEAPPIGNCTLTEAFNVVGDRLTLIGNIQYDDFRSFTPAQMREAVAAALAEGRGRRFILSPTAGPFDPNPPPRLIENYLAFIEAGGHGQ